MKRRILILSYSPIARDPRVMRQVRALNDEYHISVVGMGPKPEGVDEFIEITLPPTNFLNRLQRGLLLLARQFENVYWGWRPVRATLQQMQGRSFDLVLANDVLAVPVALRIAAGVPVVFDGHEYSPREFEDSVLWRLFFRRYVTYLCERYLPVTHGSMTVCESIALEYRKHCGINPIVVYNSPLRQTLPVKPVDLGRVRLVHHGIAGRARQLELMIDLVGMLDDRFTLDLMLVNSDPAYLDQLRGRAAGNARIVFREPVQMEQISATINEYDMGVFLLPPSNLNYQYALPNKFFEFIQARLAIAIGPSLEMALLVEKWGVGVVAPDFEPATLAHMLNALTADDIFSMKQRSAQAAEFLHAGVVSGQVRSLVANALTIS